MGYLIAALVIVLAVVVAVAVAKFLFSLLVLVVGVAAAIYVWYRLKDPFRRPHPINSADERAGHPARRRDT